METREHVLRPHFITLSAARLRPRRQLAWSGISPLIEIMTCQHPSHMSSKYTTDRVETIERYEGAHMNVMLQCMCVYRSKMHLSFVVLFIFVPTRQKFQKYECSESVLKTNKAWCIRPHYADCCECELCLLIRLSWQFQFELNYLSTHFLYLYSVLVLTSE